MYIKNNNGFNCACLLGDEQTETVVIPHCNGVGTTSHTVLNTLNARKSIESNITSSFATVCTINAPITSVQLPSTCAGNLSKFDCYGTQ